MLTVEDCAVWREEKSYVDKGDDRKTFDFNLFRISPEILIDHYYFYHSLSIFLIAVRQEVKSTDNSVVVHEQELAIKRNL